MRRSAANIGDEGNEIVILVGHDVRRREIMSDGDQRLAAIRLGDTVAGRIAAGQFAHDALDDLADIVAAFAQVRIVDGIELFDQQLHLLDDGPFGVTAALANDLLGRFRQVGVGKNHHVQIDEGADVGCHVAGVLA